MIFVQFLLLALGFAMLIKGADWFVSGAAGIATRFGIPQIVIGLTIVAMEQVLLRQRLVFHHL